MSILERMRPDILAMTGYASAKATASVDRSGFIRLDANESFESPVADVATGASAHRYDSGERDQLTARMAHWYGVDVAQLLLTRGADEAIDLLVRGFCVAGRDRGLICTPGFDYYRVALTVQGCGTVRVPLDDNGQLDLPAITAHLSDPLKIIFLCSPNNPTGVSLKRADVISLLDAAPDTVVVLDEAYIEFSTEASASGLVAKYPNLVILRTLSKAFGLAGARVGAMIAAPEIIAIMAKVQAPYPLTVPSMMLAREAFSPVRLLRMRSRVDDVRRERARMMAALQGLGEVTPSEANFILIKSADAGALMDRARRAGVIIRDQSRQIEGAVRISVGNAGENDVLIAALTGENRPVKRRTGEISRTTNETEIIARVDLDGGFKTQIDTGVGFFDHMIDQIAKHSGVSVELFARGDTEIDIHHLVEDCMIVVGQALRDALGDKRGLARFGFEVPFEIPMDEASASIRLDLSGRPFVKFEAAFNEPIVGDFPVSMTEHAMRSLCDHLGASLQVTLQGENSHHMIEACFKGLGRALGMAIRKEGDEIPSSKGIL